MISIEEKNVGTSGSTSGWTIDYVVIATDDDAASNDEFTLAEQVAANAAPTLTDSDGNVLILADVQLSNFHDTPAGLIGFYSASYGPPEEGTNISGLQTAPLSEAVYEFAYQAPTAHVFFALKTVSYGTNPPPFDNRIKCRYDGGDLVHDGIDLPSGTTTNVWRVNVPRGFCSGAYESLVENMMGCTNAYTFKGRPPGTMRFVSCQSSTVRAGSLSMTWGFQYSPNIGSLSVSYGPPFGGVVYDSGIAPLKIDDISGVCKPGHWISWNLDEKKFDPTSKKMILKARAIYSQQVFEIADFNELGF